MRAFLPGGSGVGLTDQEGRFRIDDVGSEERWILSAEADEYVLAESEPFQVGAGEVKEVDLAMSGGGHVEGRVVDEQGRFVEGVRVQVGTLPADRAGQGLLSAWEVDRYLEPRVWFTDAEGRFLATSLRPGTAVVKAEREGYVTFYKRGLRIQADDTVSGYMVALQKGDVMEGTVQSAGGRPVPGAFVAVTKSANPGQAEQEAATGDDSVEPNLSAQADGDGRFRIENIPPGTYSVVVWFAPGYQAWARGNSPKAIRRGVSSSATDVEFRLDPTPPPEAGVRPPGPR